MSQRDSGYERKERDLYETPAWVTCELVKHLPQLPMPGIWEPACGSGKMVAALNDCALGFVVTGTDIVDGKDFLKSQELPQDCGAIITNPPYTDADLFIKHALNLIHPRGVVAMLLRTDFDHAKGRMALFSGCPAFSKKLVLTRRIRWFEDSTGSPSFNHAWFIWDWQHKGQPTLAYA